MEQEKNIYERVSERDDAQEITLVSKKHEYGDVYTFEFKPTKEFSFVPGQFGHFLVHDFNLNKGKPVRDFSFASVPGENILLSMHVRKGSEFKQKMGELEPGDAVTMFKIRGSFVLPDDSNAPVVLLAGGIGITPIRSMLLSGKNENSTLIHVSESDHLYKEELEAHSFAQERVSSSEVGGVLRTVYKEKSDALFYVSGPPPFVRAMRTELVTIGVPLEHIKQDAFEGYDSF